MLEELDDHLGLSFLTGETRPKDPSWCDDVGQGGLLVRCCSSLGRGDVVRGCRSSYPSNSTLLVSVAQGDASAIHLGSGIFTMVSYLCIVACWSSCEEDIVGNNLC